jgi:hypothetical protein
MDVTTQAVLIFWAAMASAAMVEFIKDVRAVQRLRSQEKRN